MPFSDLFEQPYAQQPTKTSFEIVWYYVVYYFYADTFFVDELLNIDTAWKGDDQW